MPTTVAVASSLLVVVACVAAASSITATSLATVPSFVATAWLFVASFVVVAELLLGFAASFLPATVERNWLAASALDQLAIPLEQQHHSY